MHPFNHHSKVLFVLKYRQLYSDVTFSKTEEEQPYTYFSSGLLNSAKQVNDMLNDHHVESKLVQVIDNNAIDREVTYYKQLENGKYEKATDVIIEALWVVPEKFKVLQKLHPKVRWIVRLHSETPFMANEGIAMEWTLKYLAEPNVYVAVNSLRMLEDLKGILSCEQHHKLMYLPNYYDYKKNFIETTPVQKDPDTIDIACFGAIRPLKNQLLQAMAAIKYAKEHNLKLNFHLNGSRVENKGDNVIKNIRAMFAGLDTTKYTLVEHGWMTPIDFRVLCTEMDLGMQVSLTETFNIVTADMVAQGVPVVVSDEVMWASCASKVSDPTDINSIVSKMKFVLGMGTLGVYLNKRGLRASNIQCVGDWLHYFRK
jgi:glycosyltransferase involved in cell wall biosynthesis